MRLNLYSQELITHEAEIPFGVVEAVQISRQLPLTELVRQVADTGIVYSAVRLFLHSPSQLHARPDDDDRSALTFWLPKSPQRREFLARTFEAMARWIRDAPSETGLD